MIALGLAWVVPALAGQLCFTPPDQTAGWKRIDIPDDAPGLMSTSGVQQFRVGEAAWLVERAPTAYQGMTRPHLGQSTFHFNLPNDARRLDIAFAEDLRGAKVDAVAIAQWRRYTLFEGRRVPDDRLSVEWGIPAVEKLEITVHQHFRPVPVVSLWTVGRYVDLGTQMDIPPAFRVTRSLYYRHPGGQTVVLCDLHGPPLTVERSSLAGFPETVRWLR